MHTSTLTATAKRHHQIDTTDVDVAASMVTEPTSPCPADSPVEAGTTIVLVDVQNGRPPRYFVHYLNSQTYPVE